MSELEEAQEEIRILRRELELLRDYFDAREYEFGQKEIDRLVVEILRLREEQR